MRISRFAGGLLALGITSLPGCCVTLQELHERNPVAATSWASFSLEGQTGVPGGDDPISGN